MSALNYLRFAILRLRNRRKRLTTYREHAKRIPWTSMGRRSVAHRVGQSLVPVGVLPFEPVPFTGGTTPTISKDHPEWEKFLMHIVGTAIHGGDHKFVTCLHVVQAIGELRKSGYFLSRLSGSNNVFYFPYPIEITVRYMDPRTK